MKQGSGCIPMHPSPIFLDVVKTLNAASKDQVRATSYKYSTNDRTAPSIPCTFSVFDSMT